MFHFLFFLLNFFVHWYGIKYYELRDNQLRFIIHSGIIWAIRPFLLGLRHEHPVEVITVNGHGTMSTPV